MKISWIIYYLCSIVLLFSITSLTSTRCALSVMLLAGVFTVVGLIFFTMGAEFLAILLLVIYAGAIILLFLFVIFLLNLRTVELYNSFRSYIPVGVFMSILLWVTLCLAAFESFTDGTDLDLTEGARWQSLLWATGNVHLFGHLLYEHFGFFTIIVAVVLLTVMCAVILVTLDIDNKEQRHIPLSTERELALTKDRLTVSTWTKAKAEKRD